MFLKSQRPLSVPLCKLSLRPWTERFSEQSTMIKSCSFLNHTANSKGKRESRSTSLGKRVSPKERPQNLNLVLHKVYGSFPLSAISAFPLSAISAFLAGGVVSKTECKANKVFSKSLETSTHFLQHIPVQGLPTSSSSSLTACWAAVDVTCISQVGDMWGLSPEIDEYLMLHDYLVLTWSFPPFLSMFSTLRVNLLYYI